RDGRRRHGRDRVDEVGLGALRARHGRGRRDQRRCRFRPRDRRRRPVRRGLAREGAPVGARGGTARPGGLRAPHGGGIMTAAEARGGFAGRHIGSAPAEQQAMVAAMGSAAGGAAAILDEALPGAIRTNGGGGSVPAAGVSEAEALAELRALAARNRVLSPMIGRGYSDTITPSVIQRNVFENPSWYTAY